MASVSLANLDAYCYCFASLLLAPGLFTPLCCPLPLPMFYADVDVSPQVRGACMSMRVSLCTFAHRQKHAQPCVLSPCIDIDSQC